MIDGIAVDWIAVDWGTSNLRAWAMAGEAAVAARSSDQGMGRLAPGDYPAVLAAITGGSALSEVPIGTAP